MGTDQEICIDLVHADHEKDVIRILTEAGYWDAPNAWRDLGDMENNFSTAGAQQSDPVAALVEKLVNAADASLMNACLSMGIDPESSDAPPSVRHAVAQMIQKSANPENETNGLIENMTRQERTELARKITLAATGAKGKPSLTIVDEGEGQSPDRVPHTFMSLNKSNKLRVPFVQGRFNMGGTGALRFCGDKRLQLIVTKRNPKIADQSEKHHDLWSFTVVRRETPTTGERNSVYRYLAPVGADAKRKGGLLRFAADTLPVKPDGNTAYSLPLEYGSLVKLYSYKFTGTSNILMSDGLLRQVDVRLPSPALPIMFHECRDYAGKEGSFANPSTGLSVRLSDNQAGNLANGFPYDEIVTVDGQEFSIRYFGFKDGRAKTYLNKSEGVLFVVNGQTQGVLHSRFFTRRGVGLNYVSNSLMARVDCSKIDQWAHEELFMNTRESLADSEFRRKVEQAIQKKVGENAALKAFNHQRRTEKIKEKVQDDRTLEDVLKNVMKKSPTLSALFLTGTRLSDPTSTAPVSSAPDFVGVEFPTYFRFRNKNSGETLIRNAEQGREIRMSFDTDAENNYFGRSKERARYGVIIVGEDNSETVVQDHSMNLHNGTANLKLALTDTDVGDKIRIKVIVTDTNRLEPFINFAEINIVPFVERETGGTGGRNPPSNNKGNDQLNPTGLALPHVEWVAKDEWSVHEFDKHSALKVIQSDQDGKNRSFDFYINADNVYLKKELERAKGSEDLLKEQFKIGLVLVGLALIHEASDDDGKEVSEKVEYATRAMSMMLIPMINSLGDLDPSELGVSDAA
ncbi:hypothetical protein So717_38540 [Roseobacter cerasinus]|uniref:Uncharacterized protein n=1 Tax=Roseobacter cerasinus TaxID=2602289 RepID=A0A640VYC8_9RHOB|nr:hypothetical protein [Roseobacter cerasinus]GFE52101.1 hypothetical protein So717_38540 [Roseobacter cerasinus]